MKEVNHKMQNGKIKYFSMFTGVGGFELGFENARGSTNLQGGWNENSRGPQSLQSEGNNSSNETTGYTCVGFSEIDKYANQLLANKFPEVRNYGDATKINASELPDFDMLCGGFPCQSFSIAGKRRGFQDTRGTMFFHIARILEVKRPNLVFLENVKGLLNHDKGQTFSVIIQTLEELGYNVQWMVLNSKFHGVPQNRERVFIIGSLRGQPRPEILPFRGSGEEIDGKVIGTLDTDGWEKRHESIRRVWDTEGTAPTIPTAQGGGVMTKIAIARGRPIMPYKTGERQLKYEIYEDTCPTLSENCASGDQKNIVVTKTAIPVLTPDRLEKRQNGRRFKEDGDESFTLTKQDIHGVAIMDLYNNKEHTDRTPALTEPHHNSLRIGEGKKIRRLTPTECERLQGFPDGWTSGFSDTQRYKMMGNAVTTKVISAIANRLVVFSEKDDGGKE